MFKNVEWDYLNKRLLENLEKTNELAKKICARHGVTSIRELHAKFAKESHKKHINKEQP